MVTCFTAGGNLSHSLCVCAFVIQNVPVRLEALQCLALLLGSGLPIVYMYWTAVEQLALNSVQDADGNIRLHVLRVNSFWTMRWVFCPCLLVSVEQGPLSFSTSLFILFLPDFACCQYFLTFVIFCRFCGISSWQKWQKPYHRKIACDFGR